MTNLESSPFQPTATLTLPVNDSQELSQSLVWTIAEAADDRKAEDIVILDVGEISYLTDYFVIVTGFSKTQLRAISHAIEEKVAQAYQKSPTRIEGKTDASWIVQDYSDVIVHIFLPQEREFYNLEAFWGHAKRIPFPSL